VGYELYITRRKRWHDDSGQAITEQEWQSYLATDPDLRVDEYATVEWTGGEGLSLSWSDGNVAAKYPTPAAIKKMATIAEKLGARVVGEESEDYSDGSGIPVPYKPSLMERVAAVLRSLVPRRQMYQHTDLKVGDRVTDCFHKTGEIVAIDLKGIGTIRVRYDNGREAMWAAIGDPLKKVSSE
jgi:hypothetical protein